ncbi:DNA-binding helix-turn-helix protein [Leptospira weilii serovar Ranarum str. ICFT]|uniref:DNA-binding helix-turn-helix protein n=1 Tax=Leptospira weilii serovar Ranarum str. ICFT TaxID=1218598 RepID=N1WLC0_9LEPT|nr:helix-turn-helix transcriptional regulator [Leptospira weilii]EMY76593.1 DNA-binding helix-turn-helix protein [Leptospira weilii serovar Ranarum str. ICFT]
MFKSLHSREAKIFCKNLIAARKDAELTQLEVAERLGEPQSYISKIESGERRLDVIEFWRIYKILGKSFEFYFHFDDKQSGFEKKSKSKTLKAASSRRNRG